VNKNGNSAFYFALAYVTTGQLAKFLVEHGADDTIQNYLGLTE
jgi:ankyrin repeat protein